MEIKITGKLLKFIIFTAVFLSAFALICLGIGIYQNHKFFNEYTELPVTDDNAEVVMEWLAEYDSDTKMLEQIDKDLAEAQERLEKLGVDFNE